MKNEQNVPQVRFKGFTDAWEQRELGSISEKVTKKNQDMVCDEVFTNSAEYGIISQRDFFDKDIANSENIDGYYIVEPNDFVYNPRISNLAPFGPIRRNKLDKSGAMSPLYYVFRTHGVDYGFLEYYFKTNGWHSFMHLNGNSGARSDRFAIRDDIFREMPITMPQNVVEQQAIGNYFTNLDSLITLHQRKCETLQKLKKSMLQKMFPKNGSLYPEIRFAGFTDAWEQREFGNIANRMSETSLSSDELPYIEYEDVISNQGILNKDVSTKEGVKTGIVFSEEDVLYGKLRPYLHNWLNPDFKGVAVGDWWVLKPINADKNFLYRLIQSENFDNVANQSTGTKMPRADWKLVSATVFCVPKSLKEQAEIGQYFRNLDNLITLHQRKLETLKKMKKSMLQKMFI